MAYIDIAYYRTFTGDTTTLDEDITALLAPVSRVINSVARGQIGKTLDGFNAPTQEAIKDATAALVQYLLDNGGMNVLVNGNPNYGSASIGSFSYGDARLTASDEMGLADSRINQMVIDLLLPTGLLYAGMGC